MVQLGMVGKAASLRKHHGMQRMLPALPGHMPAPPDPEFWGRSLLRLPRPCAACASPRASLLPTAAHPSRDVETSSVSCSPGSILS